MAEVTSNRLSIGSYDDYRRKIKPPETVRGMLKLDREMFRKKETVPMVKVPTKLMEALLPKINRYTIKMPEFHSVYTSEEDQEMRVVLFNPLVIKDWHSLPQDGLKACNLDESCFCYTTVTFTYENWHASEILKAVLPEDVERLCSYALVGHVVQLNLRDALLPYKTLIGEVWLDKVPNCRTVVNKLKSINNIYRISEFHLLAGAADYVVKVKENNNIFKFDMSKVYWNSRLSTERDRVAAILRPNDIYCDIFAGVGSYAVPIARKGCTVFANDSHPESFRWLQYNTAKLANHAKRVHCFNMDGTEFIKTVIKKELLARWMKKPVLDHKFVVCIDQPTISLQFLKTFRGLFIEEKKNLNFSSSSFTYPFIMCYVFAVEDTEQTRYLIKRNVEYWIGLPTPDTILTSIEMVHNVSQKRKMYRISITLNEEILTTPNMNAERPNIPMRELDPNTLTVRVPRNIPRAGNNDNSSKPKKLRQ